MSRTEKDASAKEKECGDLQDSLRKEKSILEEMSNGTENVHLVYLDRDFNFVRVNEAYAKTCGYKPEEMIGKNHFALYPGEEVEAVFRRVRDTGVPAEFHDRPFVFPDQAERGVTYWDWTLKPVKNEAGEVEGLVFSLVETTERKKAEEEIRNLAKFPSENPSPVMRINKDGFFLYCNGAAKQILEGLKCEEGEAIPERWRTFVDAAFASGKRQEFEDEIGGRTFVLVMSPVADYANVYGHDITEHKKAEEELFKIQNRLSVATKAAKIGIHDYDIVANIIQWDDRIREIWGVDPDEPVTYETFIDNVHPDDRVVVQAEMNKALDPEKGQFYAEYRVINRKDKTVRWVYATGKTFFDDNCNAVRLIGTAEDVTERKKTEEVLWQQAQLLHLSYDAIIVRRKDGGIEQWNRGAEQLYGYTESEARGRVTHELLKTIHPAPWSEIEAAMLKHGQWEGELHHHAKDGHEVIVSARHQLVVGTDGIERILETNRDITKDRKAEEALRRSEEQLRRAIQDAPIPVIMHAEDGEVLQISRSWTELTGYTINHVRSFDEWITEAVYGEGADKVRDNLHDLFKGAKHLVNEEFAIKTISGDERFWIFSASSPGTLVDGRRYIVGMAVDITERKKAQDALVSSEKRYRRLFETSQDGIMARDLNGCMIDCNQAYARMLGYSKEELASLRVDELLPEKWHEQRNRIFREVLEHGGSAVFEREYRRKDGVVFPASVRSWRLTDENGKVIGVWSIVRDITRRRTLERKLQNYTTDLEKLVEVRTAQLKDAERLAAIGSTAGMVGHDIRNPLQAIVSDLYLAKSDLAAVPESEEKEGLQESLTEIEKNVDYINKIVQDLQDYARPLRPNMRETDFGKFCFEVLFNDNLPESIDATYRVDEKAKNFVSDPELLKRILINLVNNAVQAMPDGGKLEVQARRELDEVVITVQDTGVGVPEEIKDKLFTPLFTTKSKGQGFGLPVVKRMTEALGGAVTFESEKGKGAKFTVRLPVAKK